MNGALIVNKPAGLTSHDVVNKIRRHFKIKKVGHTGTLDPAATGVLPVLIGDATKLSRFLIEADKVYRGVMQLGIVTDTQDAEGEIISEQTPPALSRSEIEALAAEFVGASEQVPPMFSAVKQGGKPLYKLARQGIEVERQPKKITIHFFEVLDFQSPAIEFRVGCSKGVYIRTLAHDLGARLGCGGSLKSLVREKSGPFSLDKSVTLDYLLEGDADRLAESLTPAIDVLSHIRKVKINREQAENLLSGRGLRISQLDPQNGEIKPGESLALIWEDKIVAIAEGHTDGSTGDPILKMLKIFGNPI